MRYLFVLLLLFGLLFCLQAQDTIYLTRSQAEAFFLKENLLLLAQRYEISKAEALLVQARLWANPQLSIDEVNLWASPRQLGVFGEQLPPFGSSGWGRNQQLAIAVEQPILTAGKRRKQAALEQTNITRSEQQFEELLRKLKLDLRSLMTELQYTQQLSNIYERQSQRVQQLIQTYGRQVEAGNIAKGEYARLKALEMNLLQRRLQLRQQQQLIQKDLRLLLNLPAHTQLLLAEADYRPDIDKLKALKVEELIEKALIRRSDLQLAALDQQYAEQLYYYERAQRIPNLNLKAAYDRGGNFMYNFIGFGVGVEIPLFNRNQGNIQFARLQADQSRLLYTYQQQQVISEITTLYEQLHNSLIVYESMPEGYQQELDELLDAYTKNFVNRNIGLLEFLDFVEAYIENKQIFLEWSKQLREQSELINYAVGEDIIR